MTTIATAAPGCSTSTFVAPSLQWAGPHSHRIGPHDRRPSTEVAMLLQTLPYWNTLSKGHTSAQRRGVGAILAWLQTCSGDGWQERWLAANADMLPWSRPDRGELPIPGERVEVVAGLRPLLLLRVVAPGYDLFRNYRANAVVQQAPAILHSAPISQQLDHALDEVVIAGRHRHDVSKVLVKMLLHTGKALRELEPGDFLEMRSWYVAHDLASTGLHGAWEVAERIGILSAGTTFRAALRQGPRPTSELVDRYGLTCRPVRDPLVRYLDERRPALDYNSFRSLVGVLAGTFWSDIERHHPDLQTIDLPPAVAQAWKKRLATTTDRGTGRQRPRSLSDQMGIKVKVRAFYLDIQKWAPDDPSWAPWVVPCPIRKNEIVGLAKIKRAVSAKMHQRVRDRLPRLAALVDAARVEQQALLIAAVATPLTEVFEHAGRTYRRTLSKTYVSGPFTRRLDEPDVVVLDLDSNEQINLSVAEEDTFWAWAVIETLRHTGIRLEELLELTHLALVSYPLPDTGEIVPLLQIVPSKTGQERLLLVPPELASVLAAIVARLRGPDGHIPLVARYDGYEKVTGPPLPHLFQRRRGWRRETITGAYIYRLLNATLERAGLRDATGQPVKYLPHDFRRIFASDAVTGGLPVHITAKILGHTHLGTTQHYLAVFQDELIRSYRAFLGNRRAIRPAEEYREPTEQEWTEFQQHFQQRRVELGSCGRPYAAPCQHEFACIRCPMLRVDPGQRERLVEIIDSLGARIVEAEQRGWLGEAQGLRMSLDAARAKLAGLDRQSRTDLGMPAMPRRHD